MTTQTVPIITLRMLRGACKEQRAIFKAEWPDGAEATLGNVLRAVELGLSLDWAGGFFTPTALAEYERQIAPFWAEFEREWALIWEEYEREWALLRDAHKRQGATLWQAWAEHKRQVALLLAKYQRQIAPFWLAAFLASHGGVE